MIPAAEAHSQLGAVERAKAAAQTGESVAVAVKLPAAAPLMVHLECFGSAGSTLARLSVQRFALKMRFEKSRSNFAWPKVPKAPSRPSRPPETTLPIVSATGSPYKFWLLGCLDLQVWCI